jgi:Mrp family chromosome partitioning ATPase
MGTLAVPVIETMDRTKRQMARRERMPVEGVARLAASLFRKRTAEGVPAIGKVVLLTSANSTAGVSTVLQLLARHLADCRNARVLALTPADLTHAEGLSLEQLDVRLSRNSTDSVWTFLREPAAKGPYFTPARTTPAGRKEILEHLRRDFDCVLLDAPSVSQYSERAEETLETCALADGVLLVVAAGRSTRDDIREAQQSITAAGGVIEGCCLNRNRRSLPTFLQRWFGR